MTDDIKRPKRPRDANQLAKFIVDIATGATPSKESQAAMRARKAGLVGGRARAEALTPDERSEVAKKAAKSRWSKQNSDQ